MNEKIESEPDTGTEETIAADSGLAESQVIGGDGAAHNSERQLWELALWRAIRQTPRRELSAGAKLCLDVIARFERSDLECWAGLLRLGHEVGVTESQASRYINELANVGYIEKVQGRSGRSIYRRTFPPELRARATRNLEEIKARAR